MVPESVVLEFRIQLLGKLRQTTDLIFRFPEKIVFDGQFLNPLKMLVVVGSNSGAGNIFSPLNLHKRPLATNLGLKICKFVSCVYCSRCTQGANKYTIHVIGQ